MTKYLRDVSRASAPGVVNHKAVVVLLVAVLMNACSTPTRRDVDAQGRYCFQAGKSRQQTCTNTAVPSAEIESTVKRFEPDVSSLTVVVVRSRWADMRNQVDVQVDDKAPISTIPSSFVQLKLQPGQHRLSMRWTGGTSDLVIDGRAGEVRFVELVGSVWSWSSSYVWVADDEQDARTRATSSRLIAVQ